MVGLIVGSAVGWFSLSKLTGFPLTSAAILGVWIFLSFALQARSENLDDELDGLIDELKSAEAKLSLLESLEPLADQIRKFATDQAKLSGQVTEIEALLRNQKEER